MEATTARIVGHEFDHAPPQTVGPTETGERILEVLRKAQVREDRHMSRERIARELGAFRGGCAAIYRSLDALAKSGRVTERLDLDFGETTFHLPIGARSAPASLFERMVASSAKAPASTVVLVRCPHCDEEFQGIVGCNRHIGQKHKSEALLTKTPQASCSTPKPSGMLALLSGGVTPTPTPTDDEEDEELPDVLEGAGVTSIAALHRQLMLDAGKHGWTIEVLQASKPQGEGAVRFSYTHAASKVAS